MDKGDLLRELVTYLNSLDSNCELGEALDELARHDGPITGGINRALKEVGITDVQYQPTWLFECQYDSIHGLVLVFDIQTGNQVFQIPEDELGGEAIHMDSETLRDCVMQNYSTELDDFGLINHSRGY